MRIPQEPLAEAANRELWSLHDAVRAESECDSLVASESGDVCCEREQILVFQNLSDAQKIALCGDWHSAEAVTRVVAAATVFGAATLLPETTSSICLSASHKTRSQSWRVT